MLNIQDLQCVLKDGTQILRGLSLQIKPGEIHAIMGPNGSGKSTLARVLSGHPDFEVSGGSADFNGENIFEFEASERANKGLFVGFQHPIEIPGVNNVEFIRLAVDSKRAFNGLDKIEDAEFNALIAQHTKLLEMDQRYIERGLNEGFSGGEKKRNEILQMAMLDPQVAILDETDSGVDIDALRIIAHGINALMTPQKAVILITHYQRLLDLVKPDFVHVLSKGKIIKSGGPELALELESKGYDWLVKWKIWLERNLGLLYLWLLKNLWPQSLAPLFLA